MTFIHELHPITSRYTKCAEMNFLSQRFRKIMYRHRDRQTGALKLCAAWVWISCFSVFRSKSLELITCHYPWISVISYFQTSSKDILQISQPTPFQLPTLPRTSSSTHPDSSKTLALYKSCTYLPVLTYIPRCFMVVRKTDQSNTDFPPDIRFKYLAFGRWQWSSNNMPGIKSHCRLLCIYCENHCNRAFDTSCMPFTIVSKSYSS